MLWLWILGIALLLFLLLCLLRVGVRIHLGQQTTAFLLIGPLRIQLIPSAKDKKPSETKKRTSTEGEQKSNAAVEKLKSIPKPNWEDVKDAYRTLKPVALKALRRTRRGIRIHPLDISVILGGREDPAQTAEYYGYAQAAVWTAMPVLEQLLVIPEPAIHIGMDFEADKTQVQGTVGIGIRIGTLLVLAFGVAVPAVRWFMKYYKRKKAESKTNHQPAQAPAT